MPRNRVAMHNIKEVMRLHHKLGHSQREIARILWDQSEYSEHRAPESPPSGPELALGA